MRLPRARRLLLVASMLAAPIHGADYRIDGTRSYAEFSVRLLWVHQINGRFARIDGDVALSPRRDTAVVKASVLVDSVRMDSERMRRWVMTPEFFDAARYPSIQFISSPFATHALELGGELPGLLTLRGITRPVVFQLQPSRCTMKPNEPCLIEVRGTVQRSEYDMTGHRTAVSDRVQMGLLITVQPVRRQPQR